MNLRSQIKLFNFPYQSLRIQLYGNVTWYIIVDTPLVLRFKSHGNELVTPLSRGYLMLLVPTRMNAFNSKLR